MNVESVLSWAGSRLFAGELPVAFGFGVVLTLVLIIVAVMLAVASSRSARAAEFARIEAEAKLSAAQNVAEEVRRMQSQFEMSLREQETAFQKAMHDHHASCSHHANASAHAPAAELSGGHDHHDDDDDDHKKHPAKKHSLSGGHDDHHDDDDDHKKKPVKKHSLGGDAEEGERRSFLSFLSRATRD